MRGFDSCCVFCACVCVRLCPSVIDHFVKLVCQLLCFPHRFRLSIYSDLWER